MTTSFQHLKETVHASLTGSSKPPSYTRAPSHQSEMMRGAVSLPASTYAPPAPASTFSFLAKLTSVPSLVGSAVTSLMNTLEQGLMEDFPQDVDGAYVCERVLALGPLRRKRGPKDRFRNDSERVGEFVRERYGAQAQALWFDFGAGASDFDGEGVKMNVVEFDLDRPTLEVLREATAAVLGWLAMDDKNVAILTCTNGIKSTMLVAAGVVAEVNKTTVRNGLCQFFNARMKLDKPYGALIHKLPASYNRIVKAVQKERDYRLSGGGISTDDSFEDAYCSVGGDSPLDLLAIVIRRLPLHVAEDGSVLPCDPKMTIRMGAGLQRIALRIYRNSVDTFRFDESTGYWGIRLQDRLLIEGDCTLDVSLGGAMETLLFSFPFHVDSFRGGEFKFGPDEMDEAKRHMLPGDFQLELAFRDVERLVEDVSFAKPTLSGRELCSLRHVVRASDRSMHELCDMLGASERDATFALQRSNNDFSKAAQLLFRQGYSRVQPGTTATSAAQQQHHQQQANQRKVLGRFDENVYGGGVRNVSFTPRGAFEKKSSISMIPGNFELTGKKSLPTMVTPIKGPKRTPGKSILDIENIDPTLSPFLRDAFGHGLSSPISPIASLEESPRSLTSSSKSKIEALAMNAFDDEESDELTTEGESRQLQEEEMDKVLVQQLASFISKDAKNAEMVSMLTKGKARIVVGGEEETTAVAVSVALAPAPVADVAVVAPVLTVTASIVVVEPVKIESVATTTGLNCSSHETYGTFFKMMKMGVPRSAVEQRMRRDGFLTETLDLDANAPIEKLLEILDRTTKKLQDDEKYGKFFKMLKMGVPHQAVQQRMAKEGIESEALDLGPNGTLAQLAAVLKEKEQRVQVPKKKVLRAKTIRWEPIPEERLQKGSTIWHHDEKDNIDFAGDDLRGINTSELEGLFVSPPKQESDENQDVAAIANAKRVAAKAEAVAAAVLNANASVLDARRAQSVSIGVAKLKMSGEALAAALNAMDEEVISGKVVQIIQGCNLLPSSLEMEAFQSVKDVSRLAGPDAFLAQLAFKCPDSARRVEALTFRYVFDEVALATKDSATSVRLACEQVRSSAKLKNLLRVVLVVGNKINSRAGDDEGDRIRAFTLASLLKLSQTKSLNKTTTVLEYLVHFLAQKMPEVMDVEHDLNLANIAKRVDLVALSRNLRDLERGLSGLGGLLEVFRVRAIASLAEVERELDAAREAFCGVLEYFGEDLAMTSCDFFSTLQSFLLSFAANKKEYVEREEREKRKLAAQSQRAVVMANKAEKADRAEKFEKAERAAGAKRREMEEIIAAVSLEVSATSVTCEPVSEERYPALSKFFKGL